MIFNGEIYNYKELRELEELGYNFRTNGDTEVFHYFIAGVKAFKNLMECGFGLNGQTGDVLLSRDRFGEKPLYTWPTESGIFLHLK